MKLQVVTVSVNYSDFLEHTLEQNYKLFDRWVIVTDLKDQKTRDLCFKYPNVLCISSDCFYRKGAPFNKYAGINEGLKHIDDDAWVLFLDSDVVLHYETRRVLENIHLDERCIYGMDRLNCSGLEKWIEYSSGKGQLLENWLLVTSGLEVGTRLVHHYGHEGENGRFEGWRPLGFFQLCHRSTFGSYPEDHHAADHCDLLFSRLWSRRDRVLIPELYAVHLESYGAGKAINWYGRRSKPFVCQEKPIEESIQPTECELITLLDKIILLIKKIVQRIIDFFKDLCQPPGPKPY